MYQQTLVGGWGTMVAGVFDYKDQYEGNDSCRSNWIMIITSCYAWNFLKKQNRYFELFSNAFSQSKARPAYIAEMKAKLGDEQWIKIWAKWSTMRFGIIRTLTMFIKLFQTNLNLVWNLCLANHFFVSKPNWNWFVKSFAFFGCNFSKPNWIWFGKGHWIKCSCKATARWKFLKSGQNSV